jgi:hypothetical protein
MGPAIWGRCTWYVLERVNEALPRDRLQTEEKSNEITPIPESVERVDIEGAVVTFDAMCRGLARLDNRNE